MSEDVVAVEEHVPATPVATVSVDGTRRGEPSGFELLAEADVTVAATPPPSPRATRSHQILNTFDQPVFDAFASDGVLADVVRRAGATWIEPSLAGLGTLIGSAELQGLAHAANKWIPVLHTHDRYGRRLDRVEYHPAYHELMRLAYASGVHSLAWTEDRPGAQVARAALSYLWNQGENGIGCPHVMSYSIVPLLRANPGAGGRWEPGVLSTTYDPRHLPPARKDGLTVAMSMTEKQGGSDLRANITRAEQTGTPGEYVLSGHKFFCSAPMGDLILLTARTKTGVSLFGVPRLLPDGTHNGIYIQRLKDKLGNRSNASSEIEIDGTLGYLLGEEGHGLREFVQRMTHYIRLDFSVASAGIMRQALSLAAYHVRSRTAFDRRVADLPQMRNALADLALEWEAALRLGMRLVGACDAENESDHDGRLLRIGVPIAKYWNCRRANHFVLEALECHGGIGYIEEQPIARLFREAPINSIWEGTAAMMGLDFVRSLHREPETRQALLDEIAAGASGDRRLQAFANELERELGRAPEGVESHARRLMGHAALGLQASLMNRYADAEAAELFVASRLGRDASIELGTLPADGPVLTRIAERAVPE